MEEVESLNQKPYDPGRWSRRLYAHSCRGSPRPIVQLLLEAGADKDATTSEDRWTALYIAACNGHVEVVRLLREAGTDKDAATASGATPVR